MQLFIDNSLADMDELSSVSISLSVASILNPESARTGYSNTISIPMTPNNRNILDDCEQLHSAKRFNSSAHYASLVDDGCVIMEGSLFLVSCSQNRYNFNIIGNGKNWAIHASENTFDTLFPDFSATLSGPYIAKSWYDSTPVRWLPVLRHLYSPSNSSQSIYPPARPLSENDYHPFIHLRSVMHAIFNDAGYKLVSNFFDSDYFETFYMSGMFKSHNTSSLENSMGFMAARSAQTSASADANGRVYADPLKPYNSLGNIVNTTDPAVVKNAFDNGGCFDTDASRISFTPKQSLSVGFEYKLKYVTDYRIINRFRLAGFDKLYLGNGAIYEFQIPNPFEDQRNKFRPGKSYSCTICDFRQGSSYQLVADIVIYSVGGIPTKIGERTIASFSTRTATVSSSANESYANLRILHNQNGSFVKYDGEWTLYDGFVKDQGSTEVEITVRSAPEKLSPSNPKYFDTLYFGGADAGMSLTLKSAEVRPVFHELPATGSSFTFKDIAAHNISRMQVVNAIRDMFSLCFLTDEIDKTVYAEPRTMFYRNDTVVDWSDKLDLSKNFRISDIAADMPNTLSWSYQNGDTTSDAASSENDRFGCWTITIGNTLKPSDTKNYKNSLFTPTINMSDVMTSAPSASLPCAGNIYADETSLLNNMNFQPKIVRYIGIKTLPDGEQWGWPTYTEFYPFAAFHGNIPDGLVQVPVSPFGFTIPLNTNTGPSDKISLCYEDRDSCTGLHSWWDSTVDTWIDGRRIEAYFKLLPEDIEPFLRPDSLMADFRARFRLHIDGEWSDWRLEEICNYDPATSSTKCILIQII